MLPSMEYFLPPAIKIENKSTTSDHESLKPITIKQQTLSVKVMLWPKKGSCGFQGEFNLF